MKTKIIQLLFFAAQLLSIFFFVDNFAMEVKKENRIRRFIPIKKKGLEQNFDLNVAACNVLNALKKKQPPKTDFTHELVLPKPQLLLSLSLDVQELLATIYPEDYTISSPEIITVIIPKPKTIADSQSNSPSISSTQPYRWNCPCKRRFFGTHLASLLKHIQKNHENARGYFDCPFKKKNTCQKSFDRPSGTIHHLEDDHAAFLVCGICRKICEVTDLDKHCAAEHDNEKILIKKRNFN